MLSKNEAIRVLKLMAADLTGCLAGLPKSSPMADVIVQRLEAIETAKTAMSFAAGGCYCRECRWGQVDDAGVMHCHKYHCHKKMCGFCDDGEPVAARF